jgi:hypothetical protein
MCSTESKNAEGATVVEYSLIVSLIAVVVAVGVETPGTHINKDALLLAGPHISPVSV